MSGLVKREYSKLSISGVVSYVFPRIVFEIFVPTGPLSENSSLLSCRYSSTIAPRGVSAQACACD